MNEPRAAPVGPVGGNSSSGGWVHPGGRPRVSWRQLQLCRGGFFPSLALGKCAESFFWVGFFFFPILFKSRRSPPSHARCGAAIWLAATALVASAARSPRPPQPCPCPLPPAAHRPPLPAGLRRNAGLPAPLLRRCQRSHGAALGGWFCRRANSRQS